MQTFTITDQQESDIEGWLNIIEHAASSMEPKDSLCEPSYEFYLGTGIGQNLNVTVKTKNGLVFKKDFTDYANR